MSKERLVKLLIKTMDEQYEKRQLITPQHTADYLLANGVIVLNENEALIPITKKELRHIQNDVIAFCLRLEENDCDTSEAFGYSSRKALLKKLCDFELKHFDRYTECPVREEAEKKLEEGAE